MLIDDVQLLARGEATREEFFHTFNALVQSGRQLVITSDRHPAELDGIEERLSERFRSGLVVELDPPSFAVRRAILAKRARLDGIAVRDAVLDEISLRVDSSVRALEGALIQVVAYASLRGREPDVETVRKVLSRLPDRSATRASSPRSSMPPPGPSTSPPRSSGRATGGRASPSPARSRCSSRASSPTTACPTSAASSAGAATRTVLHALERVEQSLAADPGVRSAVDKVRRQLDVRRLMAEPTARIHSFCTTAKQPDSRSRAARPRRHRHLHSTSIHNQDWKGIELEARRFT